MLGHNAWANRRLIDVCSTLTDEQLDTGAEGTFGSIRDTLVHILESEQRYLFRLTEEQSDPPIQEGHWPGFEFLGSAPKRTADRYDRLVRKDDPGRRWPPS